MIKYVFLFCLFCLLSVSNILNAQFRVEEFSISGELMADDAFNPGFGRFDPVELYLSKGDVISFTLTADFTPFMALVAPSEKYYVEYSQDGSTITNYIKTIAETGTWYLSIAADSTDFGKYDLVANYMSANSITLPYDADYCTSLKFLSEHSKVNFFFMKKAAKGGNEILWEPKINLTNSINSYITENENGDSWYTAVMYESENKDSAETFYKNFIFETQTCLGTEWLSNSKDWYKTKANNMQKEELFVIKDKEIKKNIKIILDEKNTSKMSYQVSVELRSKK